MPTEKKSFVLYNDQFPMFKKLTNSQAGELIKMIFAHETGEAFKTKDLAVDIAFTSIEQHLNRDSKKWKDIQKKRIAASKQAQKKRHQVTPHDTTWSQAEGVNVNASVNAIVNDNVSLNDIDKTINKIENFPFKSKKFIEAFYSWIKYKREDHKQNFTHNTINALLKNIKSNYTLVHNAIDAIESSIANNYKNIYPASKNKKKVVKTNYQPPAPPEPRVKKNRVSYNELNDPNSVLGKMKLDFEKNMKEAEKKQIKKKGRADELRKALSK